MLAQIQSVIEDTELSFAERVVLVRIMIYAGFNKRAYPSHKLLAKKIGCSSRYIFDVLSSLRSKGRIVSWKKRGYSLSNNYILNDELYFNIDSAPTENPNSSLTRTGVPIQSRTTVPPKYRENTNINNSKPEFIPCNKNGCDGGYRHSIDIENSVYPCECLMQYQSHYGIPNKLFD